jgi:hypothetical protein
MTTARDAAKIPRARCERPSRQSSFPNRKRGIPEEEKEGQT